MTAPTDCSFCGSEISARNLFCGDCGHKRIKLSGVPPLRLLSDDGHCLMRDTTEAEVAACELMEHLCQTAQGCYPNSALAYKLIALIERDPAGLIDYIHRFVADRAAASELTRKLIETGEIPF